MSEQSRKHAEKFFTCATCKRGRNRCRDRKGCAQALANWLAQEEFVVRVAQGK